MKKYLKPAMTKAVSLEWTDGSAINENDTNGRGISAIIASPALCCGSGILAVFVRLKGSL